MTKIGIPETRKKNPFIIFITPQPQICYSEAMFIFNIFFFACLPVGCVRTFCKLGNCRKKIDQRQKCSQLKGSMDGQMLLTQIFFSWSSLVSYIECEKSVIFFDLLAEIRTHFLLPFSNKKFLVKIIIFIDMCSHCSLPLN